MLTFYHISAEKSSTGFYYSIFEKNMPEAFANCFRAMGFCSYVIFLLL